MTMCCVFIEFHPMIGVDLHLDVTPTVPPVPAPMEPHAVAALLNWAIPASTADTVRATWAHARVMQRGTDITSFIPHIAMGPALVLMPMLTATSGSKSYFGPSSVLACNTAVASALSDIRGMNLNCGDIPTPTGIVIAPNTLVTALTFGDVLGGFLAMLVEGAIQAGLNKMLGPFGNQGTVAGLFIGSPLGFSFNGNGAGPIGSAGRLAGMLGTLARTGAEALGGLIPGNESDAAAARRDWEALGAQAEREGAARQSAFPPAGWNVFGEGGDAAKLLGFEAAYRGIYGAGADALASPAALPPSTTSAALDNPNAEQF